MSLDPYLVLTRFHLDQLGATSIADLRDWQELEDRVSGDGQTPFFTRALERAGTAARSERFLLRLGDYDRRLSLYEERLRQRRGDFGSFKYFQYLTLLFMEHHLDRLTADPEAYLNELNRFLREQQDKGDLHQRITPFTLPDLRRLAFYLATGAGKTILFHVHYWQVQYYLHHGARPEALLPKGRPQYVLLLTPNEGLAHQHVREMEKSGIRARLLVDLKHNLGSVPPGTVLVIDMPKLRAERAKDEVQAEGVYYPILGQANIVFVDEGHKGTRNTDGSWRRTRDYLSKDGLLVEYSATFTQVLSTDVHRADYGKRILANYEYRYFYDDGYGKHFEPIHVDEGVLRNGYYEDAALVGGLLLYYRQLDLYLREEERVQAYNLAKPLWTFVGHTVTKAAKGRLGAIEEDTSTLTDVAKVVRFVKRFLEEPAWAQELVERAIHAEDFLGAGNPFAPHLQVFQGTDPTELYRRIRDSVFGGEGALELHLLPARGEIGLRVSAANEGRYFGLINIGDAGAFKKLVEREIGIVVSENPLFTAADDRGVVRQRSLFEEINHPRSSVNLLIGSRKFIEGWSSWRVSTMTLLYIGQGEGPQVIQLFGRGVRLLGRDRSLKRSNEEWLRPLETLYVLGLKADYVREFFNSIRKELDTRLLLPLDRHEAVLNKPLPVPRLPKDFHFDRVVVRLELAKEYAPTLTTAPKIEVVEREGEGRLVTLKGGERRALTSDELDLLNWPEIMAGIRSYARAKGYHNLKVSERELKGVLRHGFYHLVASDEDLNNPMAIQAVALAVLKRYVDRFYRTKLNEAQSRALQLGVLDVRELPSAYTISLPHDSDVLEQIKVLQTDLQRWRTSASTPIPRLYLDPAIGVLYQPLVYETKGARIPTGVRVSPAPLQESEYTFLKQLEHFWKNQYKAYSAVRLYVMRNPSKAGLGFHYRTGFYPDFILWIEGPSGWRVVLVEPHGMRNESIEDNPKLEVFTELLPRLNQRQDFRRARIELDGYILTQTSPKEIPGAWRYEPDWDRLAHERHVLVKERGTEENMRTILGI